MNNYNEQLKWLVLRVNSVEATTDNEEVKIGLTDDDDIQYFFTYTKDNIRPGATFAELLAVKVDDYLNIGFKGSMSVIKEVFIINKREAIIQAELQAIAHKAFVEEWEASKDEDGLWTEEATFVALGTYEYEHLGDAKFVDIFKYIDDESGGVEKFWTTMSDLEGGDLVSFDIHSLKPGDKVILTWFTFGEGDDTHDDIVGIDRAKI